MQPLRIASVHEEHGEDGFVFETEESVNLVVMRRLTKTENPKFNHKEARGKNIFFQLDFPKT